MPTPRKPAKRTRASRKGCWVAVPQKPKRYAVSWDVPGRGATKVFIGTHEHRELLARIVTALSDAPDACVQVRLVEG